MSTVFQLFPQVARAQERIDPAPVRAQFTALLSAGKFVFAAPPIDVFSLAQSQGALISGISFAANVDDLTFSSAIDPNNANGAAFTLALIRKGNGTRVNKSPFQFASFAQGVNFTAQFQPTATNDGRETIQMQLAGGLIQSPALVSLGVNQITITAILDLYLWSGAL